MPRTDEPYSRVYWKAIDDTKFADIWFDDRALAWWLRLLIAADQAWPASGILPPVPRAVLAKLVATTLVDVNGHRFRIHGLDAERERRAAPGRVGARARWSVKTDANALRPHSVRIAGGDAPALPPHPVRNARRDETRDTENQGGIPSSGFARVAGLVAALTKRDFTTDSKYAQTLREDVADLGVEKVIAQLQATHRANGRTYDCASLVYTAHRALYPIGPGPSSKEVRDQEDDEKRKRRDARERERLREYEAMIAPPAER